ncbi:DUF397 domain-containing protein [Streptomyces chrestomyceticus]|uniref:DUF397 domain-containing protein n=1 Tax=Streptomyces chrestomyceticus TaxID=68185 RepID=UPI0019D0F0B5|nr:DUF397 domain-containing protein [Streptomyces chrestomyceticus]
MSQLVWRKSSYSAHPQDDCVEVAVNPNGPILYRESDRPGEIARARPHTWSAFLDCVKAGSYDSVNTH